MGPPLLALDDTTLTIASVLTVILINPFGAAEALPIRLDAITGIAAIIRFATSRGAVQPERKEREESRTKREEKMKKKQ